LTQLASLQPAPTWPVAFALAAAQNRRIAARNRCSPSPFGLGQRTWCRRPSKAVPLGQNAGQRILAKLSDAIPTAVDRAIALVDSERQAFTADARDLVGRSTRRNIRGCFGLDGAAGLFTNWAGPSTSSSPNGSCFVFAVGLRYLLYRSHHLIARACPDLPSRKTSP